MNVLTSSVADDLRSDLEQARADLIAARLAQQAKDTPACRAAVAGHRARIDVLLDVYLELSDPRCWDVDQLPTSSTVSVPAS